MSLRKASADLTPRPPTPAPSLVQRIQGLLLWENLALRHPHLLRCPAPQERSILPISPHVVVLCKKSSRRSYTQCLNVASYGTPLLIVPRIVPSGEWLFWFITQTKMSICRTNGVRDVP
ncbi:hypothetical protein MSAN_02279700 [Mycena sanguinolenta]|uniref:Uncharacterized protein n=1 Tax=Mycena sanguinolenta TaxID=230812 RepID=A0A8H7CIK0_9AGAR|nr:hypothetical protein MSAN_02279700 [Mycena sanguinolenta]